MLMKFTTGQAQTTLRAAKATKTAEKAARVLK